MKLRSRPGQQPASAQQNTHRQSARMAGPPSEHNPIGRTRARRPSLAITGLAAAILSALPEDRASAIVGGASVPTEDLARQVVMIKDARGNHCTGTVIARDLVLTAAHCAATTVGLTVYGADAANAASYTVLIAVRHPQYNARNYTRAQATVDLAVLKLASPLRDAKPVPVRGRVPIPGERLVIAGFGVTASGSTKGMGSLRIATVTAVGQPSTLQLRLSDVASRGGAIAGLGACDGDSGGPVFEQKGGQFAVVGVLSWANGPNLSPGCGGLTGVTPLMRYREWLGTTARKIGSPLD